MRKRLLALRRFARRPASCRVNQLRFTHYVLRILLLPALLTACSLAPAPTPTATPTATLTPTSTFTPTPSHTPTPTPSPTPTPTPTPTFTPVYLAYGPKGVGDAWQIWATPGGGTNLWELRYDWYYDWSAGYLPYRGGDPRYVRMAWCDWTSQPEVSGGARTFAEIAAEDFVTNRRGRVWLVYNEPDDPNQCGGRLSPAGQPIHLDPAYAAHHYVEVYDQIKSADPYARVFAGGLAWLSTAETQAWWRAFVETLAAEGALGKLEGVHVHLYPGIASSGQWAEPDYSCLEDRYCAPALARAANDWYQNMHVGLGLAETPIWITEAGWLNCSAENDETVPGRVLWPITQWFAGERAWPYADDAPANPGYQAIAWYVTRDPNWFPCTYLLDGEGNPTELGRLWNDFLSEVLKTGPGKK